jgi:hypothetical protein
LLLLLRQNEFQFHRVAFNGARVDDIYVGRRLVSPRGPAMLALKSSVSPKFVRRVEQQRLRYVPGCASELDGGALFVHFHYHVAATPYSGSYGGAFFRCFVVGPCTFWRRTLCHVRTRLNRDRTPERNGSDNPTQFHECSFSRGTKPLNAPADNAVLGGTQGIICRPIASKIYRKSETIGDVTKV